MGRLAKLLSPALAAAVALAGASGARASGSAVASVTVSPTATTAPLPDDYVGLGLEFQTVAGWMGATGAPNTALVNLIHNLSPEPSIRVGGVSTDRSWWPIPGVKRSPGVTYDIGATWMRAA